VAASKQVNQPTQRSPDSKKTSQQFKQTKRLVCPEHTPFDTSSVLRSFKCFHLNSVSRRSHAYSKLFSASSHHQTAPLKGHRSGPAERFHFTQKRVKQRKQPARLALLGTVYSGKVYRRFRGTYCLIIARHNIPEVTFIFAALRTWNLFAASYI
jgi:hypothetical protein